MAEEPNPTHTTHTTHTTDGAGTVEDVLARRIGNEEQPAGGRVDEAQREPQVGLDDDDDDTSPGRQEGGARGALNAGDKGS